jgi:dipeptidyl aminopeptidase/acylaminoacyl peptidase
MEEQKSSQQESINQPQQPLVDRMEKPIKRVSKRTVFISIGIIVFIALYFVLTRNMKPSLETNGNTFEQLLKADPTPFPFVEMTIPYLRSKTYKSELRSLEPVSQNGSYNSYLTSYTSDGLKINGLLTRPTGQEPSGGWPAIVFVHGYIPPMQYRTLEKYNDYIDYLARNGFVVFKIDLRGHGDSEGEPGGGYFGSDYIVDTLHARAALASSGFVNPKKIGVWGHSMAGNVLMRSWAAQPDIPAVVIWAGAVYTYEDRDKYGINDNSYSPPQQSQQRQNRRRELFEKNGSPSASSPFWQQVIPTNYTKDLKGALQIHHAVDDDVVNVGYSRDLMDLLDKSAVPHELYEYPSGGHNIIGPSFVTAMQRTVDFYKEHLK